MAAWLLAKVLDRKLGLRPGLYAEAAYAAVVALYSLNKPYL